MGNDTIWKMLNEIYEPEDVLRFAISKQPEILGDKTPFEVLANDDFHGVNALHNWLCGCMGQVAT